MEVASHDVGQSYGDMKLHEKLQKLRHERHMTQAAIAARVGVAQSHYAKWESGTGRPYLDQGLALARAFGVSLDYLADEEMESPSASPGGVELTEGEKAVLDVIKRRGLSWVLLALTDPPIVRAAGQTREQQ
jgi:transcriptional regulator with XRE-family HTH domain